MPQVRAAQRGGNNITFFGNPPYPVDAPLRAGNDAGLILAYKNHAGNTDLPGIGIGGVGSDHDGFIVGGVLSLEQTTNVSPFGGHANPISDNTVNLGDTFQRFTQVAAVNVVAVSWDGNPAHSAFNTTLSHFTDGNGTHAIVDSQFGSIVLSAGNADTRLELFSDGSSPGERVWRPYNADKIQLGDLANPFVMLTLGVPPTSRPNGSIYYISGTGFFGVDGGVPVAFGGGGSGGVTVTDGTHSGLVTTISFAGATVAISGSTATVTVTGGGVTGSGTPGDIVGWNTTTSIADSGLQFATVSGRDGWTLPAARGFRPATTNSGFLGQNGQQFDELWCNSHLDNNNNPMILKNTGTGGVAVQSAAGAGGILVTSGGVAKMVGQLQITHDDATGSGVPLLGANCPAITTAAPYTWVNMFSSDGSSVWVAAYK